MKAVLFDLDQTLFPEADYVRSGLRAVALWTARAVGWQPAVVEEEFWKLFRRDGRGRVFDTFLAEQGLAARVSPATLLHVYRTHTPAIRLHVDAAALLTRLDQTLGLVTDGHPTAQRAKIAALGLTERFACGVCTGDLGAGAAKPAADGFRVCLERLAIAAGDAVYIGDDPAKDFAAPRALGMRTVRIVREIEPGFGWTTPGPAVEADLVVRDLQDAEGFLRA